MCGMVAGILVGELAVRIIAPQYKKTFQFHPVVGITRVPHAPFSYFGAGGTRVTHQSNADGFKTPVIAKEKPAGFFRIVLLGDSMTEAIQVPDRQSMRALLEGMMQEYMDGQADRLHAEVVNLGYSGYGTAQEYLALKEFGISYQPDVVVLNFFADNDVANNSVVLEGGKSKPFFEVAKDGQLKQVVFPQKPTSGKIKSMVTDYLVLPRFVFEKYRIVKSNFELSQKKSSTEPHVMNEGGDGATSVQGRAGVYAREYDAVWNKAWETTRALIAATQREAVQAGAHFVLVSIPAGRQVVPSWAAEHREAMGPSNIDMEKPELLLRSMADEDHIEFISLYEAFHNEPAIAEYYIQGDGHLSVIGHQAVAQRIFEAITRPIQQSDREEHE